MNKKFITRDRCLFVVVKCFLFLFFIFPGPAVGKENVVNPKEVYTYEIMRDDISLLKVRYKDMLQVRKIGTSFYGKDLLAVKLGKGKKHILIVGAHHGREWLTASLIMKMLETYAEARAENSRLGPFSSGIFDEVSIWFVPMINPDGVAIQQNRTEDIPLSMKFYLFLLNEGSNNFLRWKANGQGIDLNRQYPAGWAELPSEPSQPLYQFYKGTKPLEAPEVQALVHFTYEVDPLIAVAYHSSGREIYWKYKNKHEKRDKNIAWKLSSLTGYELSTPPPHAVGGGYTDWFITTFNRPGFTIEICPSVVETSPPLSAFEEEWERNKWVGVFLAEEAKKLAAQGDGMEHGNGGEQ